MINFTKEQLIASAHARIEFAEMMLSGELEPLTERTLSIELELARIALASLEAGPAIHRWRRVTSEPYGPYPWHYGDFIGFSKPVDGIEDEYFYSAPPAPVSVPDERYQHLSELYHAQEKRLLKLAQRIKGSSFDKYAHSPSQAIDVLESALFGEHEDDCRAAMLQGAEPVTMAYRLPANTPCKEAPEHIWLQTAGAWPENGEFGELTWCSDNQHEDDTLYVRADVVTGNSPVLRDGWVACSERMPDPDTEFRICAYTPTPHEDVRFRFVPASLFKSVCRDATHWQYMLPPAAPQQEVNP